jgi:pimeloyl-ACP methyl ester carboxylesterase
MAGGGNGSAFRHRHVDAGGLGVHVVEAGPGSGPGMLLLHGWPEDWSVFAPVMALLSETHRVVALDLPGIGGSKSPPPSGDKRTLAHCVHRIALELGLRGLTIAGHDIGGQVAYAYLRAFPGELARAVIMNVAVAGVEPWAQVVRNPHIWHFGFHAVPGLPEALVADHAARYFDYFYDALAGPRGVPAQARRRFADAYARPDALHAGFEWYRAFVQDEQHNTASHGEEVPTPVLYLRGEHEPGKLDGYVEGFRADGLTNIRGMRVPHSGHFAPLENPQAVASALRQG